MRRTIGQYSRPLLLAALAFTLFAPAAVAQRQAVSTVHAGDGIVTSKFILPQGQITVRVPNDIRAGDVISGTVIAEPAGANDAERRRNGDELSGYVVDIDGRKIKIGALARGAALAGGAAGGFAIIKSSVDQAQHSAYVAFRGQIERPRAIDLLAENGSSIGHTAIPAVTMRDTPLGSGDISVPALAQAGRPLEITGPFDGDASNTKVSAVPSGAAAGNAQEATVLAESPRQTVVWSPRETTGRIDISVAEAGRRPVVRTVSNVGVNLTAPKTTLLRGEQTTITVTVSGLQDAPATIFPLPLTVTNLSPAAISMPMGDVTTFSLLRPANNGGQQVRSLDVVGVGTGGFTVEASVVRTGAPAGGGNVAMMAHPAPQPWDAMVDDTIPIDMNGVGSEDLSNPRVSKARLDATRCDLLWRISNATEGHTKWLKDRLEMVEKAIGRRGQTPGKCPGDK